MNLNKNYLEIVSNPAKLLDSMNINQAIEWLEKGTVEELQEILLRLQVYSEYSWVNMVNKVISKKT